MAIDGSKFKAVNNRDRNYTFAKMKRRAEEIDKSIEKEQMLHCYRSSACPTCTMKGQCTTGKHRRVKRWEHEGVLEAVQSRLEQKPEMMRLRRQTVEHPFGTLKAWMGATHFLTKSLKNVSTEMS